MATIKDVAKQAGVSVATVSRVLNREGNVQPATEKRVREAIEALHYSPNLLGRNLRRNETRKILVLLDTISNQFYSRVVRGIEECAREQGYAVMICMTHGDPRVEAGFLQLLKTRLVDGAVFLTSAAEGAELARELEGVRVVQACEPQESFPTPSVSIDNQRAGYEAARYLMEMGHREIAFLGAGERFASSVRRREGVLSALREAGLPVRPEWIIEEGFSVRAGQRAARRLLALGTLPEAVFCVADSMAAGVIQEFARNGVDVPGDVSVMGFDNTQLSEVYQPSITTTRQPQYEIGWQAMSLLLRLFAGESIPPEQIFLPHEIIERESVRRGKA
ncbi:MAG: LacI family transcriptional regulator [Oscillospiraceae bacterium]|jgi:LacI family repressor for deo operon, udp, cdd, tsx, nupC, and nupG|nr:LacI family transcriptional regulator [Oscillospiraceae bacterium]